MDERLQKYNYTTPIKKLLVNQFGAAFLGIVMTSISNNTLLTFLLSCFAVVFYMAIIYTSMFDIGAKDFISMQNGTIAESKYYGLKAGLFANIPNFMIAFLIFIGYAIGGIFYNVYNIFYVVAMFWEGMYSGIVVKIIFHFTGGLGKAGLKAVPNSTALPLLLMYFAIIIPALLAAHLGYNAGLKDFHIFPQRKKDKK